MPKVIAEVHVKDRYRKQISSQSYLLSRNLPLFFFRSIPVIFYWQIYKVLLSEQRKYTYAFALYRITIFFWSWKYHLSDIRNVPLDALLSFQIFSNNFYRFSQNTHCWHPKGSVCLYDQDIPKQNVSTRGKAYGSASLPAKASLVILFSP